MKKKRIKKKAEKMGIKTRKRKKTDLIHDIQIKEGNSPCFRTGSDACGQTDCCWRNDCLPESKLDGKESEAG
ncbi:MAG: SAP domain-containing protein [Candidatus Electrothrix sp. MAN1_4]|nr:SAP domain-containing protein [Candidatus Electrothrix sp. MAN1_4]